MCTAPVCYRCAQQTRMVCAFDVPCHVTIGEFHQFVAPYADTITHLHILRNRDALDSYSVGIVFKSATAAILFRTNFNGKQFNSLEEDACRVAYVERVSLEGVSRRDTAVGDASGIRPRLTHQVVLPHDLTVSTGSEPASRPKDRVSPQSAAGQSAHSDALPLASSEHASAAAESNALFTSISAVKGHITGSPVLSSPPSAARHVDGDPASAQSGRSVLQLSALPTSADGGASGRSDLVRSMKSPLRLSSHARSVSPPPLRGPVSPPMRSNRSNHSSTYGDVPDFRSAGSTRLRRDSERRVSSRGDSAQVLPLPAIGQNVPATTFRCSICVSAQNRSCDGDGDATCPVCLEPIDPSKSPMLSILCKHVFHFDCLSKWSDSTCPVCRYVMQPAEASRCDVSQMALSCFFP